VVGSAGDAYDRPQSITLHLAEPTHVDLPANKDTQRTSQRTNAHDRPGC